MELRADAAVLMIRLSAMGDVLFSLEALASLKAERPDVRVDFLVEDRFASLLENHPLLDRVLVYPRRRWRAVPGAIRQLRQRRYDAVLDLHGNLKSAVHTFFARGRTKLGYAAPIAREGAHRWYHHAVRLPEPRPHRADQGYHLLRELGLRGEPARPVLASTPGAPSEVQADVILHPGTSEFARFKRWPLERFGELADRLVARGLRVAASHGPGEQPLVATLTDRVPDVAVVDGGATGIRGMGTIFGAARAVVAADTGPLHLAAAAGTPVVAMMGPKDAALYGPRGEGHRVLYHNVPCRPCRRRACPSPQCMLGLGVDEVEAAVLDVLEVTPS